MKEHKSIEDYDECPHCGSDFGYYQSMQVSGTVRSGTLFETREPWSPEMYGHINHFNESKFYYCIDCEKRICRVNPGV